MFSMKELLDEGLIIFIFENIVTIRGIECQSDINILFIFLCSLQTLSIVWNDSSLVWNIGNFQSEISFVWSVSVIETKQI